MSYKTKIDKSFYYLLYPLAAFSLYLIFSCYFRYSDKTLIFAILTNIYFYLIFLPLYIGTKYTLASDALYIRFGWYLKIVVPYRDMFKIESECERSPVFTMSSDRIGIFVHNNVTGVPETVSVSPKDKQGFMDELARITGIEATMITLPERPKIRLPKTMQEHKNTASRLYATLKDPNKHISYKPKAPSSAPPAAGEQQSQE